MQAKAAIIEKQGGEFVLDNVELGGPQAGELRIKIAAAGICHTDLSVRDQYYPTPLPAVLGHEGAGWVEEVGPGVVGLEEGDPVVLSFSYCGACPTCLSGEHAYCPSLFPLNFAGRRLDGSTPITRNGEDVNAMFFGQSSFATHAIVRQENCVKVASDAPLELLGPLGCGVQTGAGSVLNALQPKPGSSIAIFGAGSVGLSAVMAAKASETGTVSFIGGMDIPLIRKFACGYKGGVLATNPDAKVLEAMTGTTPDAWNDPVKGGEIAKSQMDQGSDVIYAAAGGTGIGVLQTVADAGKLGIGVDSNQNGLQPGHVLTSMVKRVDVAVYNAFMDAKDDKFSYGFSSLGLAEDGVDYAMDDNNAPLVNDEMKAAVEAAKADIISGKITVHDYMSDNACPY